MDLYEKRIEQLSRANRRLQAVCLCLGLVLVVLLTLRLQQPVLADAAGGDWGATNSAVSVDTSTGFAVLVREDGNLVIVKDDGTVIKTKDQPMAVRF